MIRNRSSTLSMMKTESNSPPAREEDLARWLSDNLGRIFLQAIRLWKEKDSIEEIRLRVNQPYSVRTASTDYFLTPSGQLGPRSSSYHVTKEDLLDTMEKMTHSSLYAAEEELRQGFLTLPGGHRVGISGEAVVEQGRIRFLRNITALNIRIARQAPRDTEQLLKLLLNQEKCLYHTLIVSPPRAGKTTLLRQLIQALSEGVPAIGLKGQTVGVVDERSELSGTWQGIPSFDLGCRTDVLDRCPKALGINMLIRSMAPSIIAVDELGGSEDIDALKNAVRFGVRILATVHAGSWEELRKRGDLAELLQNESFERAVVLSRVKGPGTIEGVYELGTGLELTGRGKMAGILK